MISHMVGINCLEKADFLALFRFIGVNCLSYFGIFNFVCLNFDNNAINFSILVLFVSHVD